MNMINYTPFNSGDLQKEINHLFSKWGENDDSSTIAKWTPLVDMAEYSDRFRSSLEFGFFK